MKTLIAVASVLLTCCTQVHAQQGAEELKKVLKALNSTKTIRYTYHRELRYFSDNYHHRDTASIYFEYMDGSPIGFRFQAGDAQKEYIYDGAIATTLDKTGLTIQTDTITRVETMDHNSYLFHSLAMLRNVLPLVLGNDSVQTSVSDTLIANERLLSIRMEGKGMYFGIFRNIEHMSVKNLRRPYYLIVDPKTYLPRQFVAKIIHDDDDRDFMTMTYYDIETNPPPPAAASWSNASYHDRYRPYQAPVKNPMVKAGAAAPRFTLPEYTPAAKTDSISLSQYTGRVVLLDFWFKSCGYCMEAMPHYNALQQKFARSGFDLLTINIEDGVSDMKFFYDKFRPGYKMLYNGQKLFAGLGLNGCPSSLLLDRKGRIIRVFQGFSQAEIEKAITEALARLD